MYRYRNQSARQRERERLPRAIRYYNQFTLRPPNSISPTSTPINEFRSRLNASDEVWGAQRTRSLKLITFDSVLNRSEVGCRVQGARFDVAADEQAWGNSHSWKSWEKSVEERVIAIWLIARVLDRRLDVKCYYSNLLVTSFLEID